MYSTHKTFNNNVMIVVKHFTIAVRTFIFLNGRDNHYIMLSGHNPIIFTVL